MLYKVTSGSTTSNISVLSYESTFEGTKVLSKVRSYVPSYLQRTTYEGSYVQYFRKYESTKVLSKVLEVPSKVFYLATSLVVLRTKVQYKQDLSENFTFPEVSTIVQVQYTCITRVSSNVVRLLYVYDRVHVGLREC